MRTGVDNTLYDRQVIITLPVGVGRVVVLQ